MMHNPSEKLKETELQLFGTFLDICEKEGLIYFLIGGSCLGAVRHKGFIPWDDDIDIAMPRPDYEKFITIADGYLPENIFLQCSETEQDYPCNYAKLRRTDTAFIEKSVSHLNINHGIFIDIFPLDGYKHSNCSGILSKIYRARVNTAFNIDAPQSIKSKLLGLVYPVNYKKARDKQRRLMMKNSYYESDYIANYCGAWGEKEIVPKSFFGNGKDGEFEGITVRLPEKHHEYLTGLYGDYMVLPPEDKRVSHHYCDVIDFEKSYKEYK